MQTGFSELRSEIKDVRDEVISNFKWLLGVILMGIIIPIFTKKFGG